MKQEKFTIEDLRNGKVAVENDGTLEELKEVLNLAFPDDKTSINGAFNYYCAADDKKGWYIYSNS